MFLLAGGDKKIKKADRIFHVLLVVASCFIVVSCLESQQGDDSHRSIDSDLAQLDSMKQEILDYVGDASCSSAEECRYIALGDKPCGGPWEYLIYCAESVDEKHLEDLVMAYNAFERDINERYQRISDCAYAMPPEELILEKGRCIAGPGSGP